MLYNHYYPTFAEYKKVCQRFFDNLDSHAKKPGTLLNENFDYSELIKTELSNRFIINRRDIWLMIVALLIKDPGMIDKNGLSK